MSKIQEINPYQLSFGIISASSLFYAFISAQLIPFSLTFWFFIFLSGSMLSYTGFRTMSFKLGYVLGAFLGFIIFNLFWEIIPGIIGMIIIELPYSLNINNKRPIIVVSENTKDWEKAVMLGGILISFVVFIGLNRAYLDYYVDSNFRIGDRAFGVNSYNPIGIAFYYRNRGIYDCPTTVILTAYNASFVNVPQEHFIYLRDNNHTVEISLRMISKSESFSTEFFNVLPDNNKSSFKVDCDLKPYTKTDPVTYVFRYLAELVNLGPNQITFQRISENNYQRIYR
jgi:hypothetical protein